MPHLHFNRLASHGSSIQTDTGHVGCRWWDLEIERVVRGKFANQKFREAHGLGRDYDDPASYFGSEGFRILDEVMGFKVGKHRLPATSPTSMWKIGADAVNLITWGSSKHTAYGVCCEELPPDMGTTNSAWGVVVVIEGDEEATNQRYCLERTVQVLKKHAPMRSEGIYILGSMLSPSRHRAPVYQLYCTFTFSLSRQQKSQLKTMILYAEFPNPEPVEVYTDPENPANSVKTYIALSGFIGDLLQQAICASCTSHSGEKGCMRCFCLTTNILPDGTGLGTQRMLGLHHPVSAQVFIVPEVGGDVDLQDREGLVFAAAGDDGSTVFNKALAAEVTLSHEQHCLRSRTADIKTEQARQAFPIPALLPADRPREEHEQRRTGASF